MKIGLTVFLLGCMQQWAIAQIPATDTMVLKSLDDIVVTATRTERRVGNVAIPTYVISQQQIRLSGVLRINELLQEQTGAFITGGSGSNAVGGGVFGNGIQLQGLSPDHTMILLDGEPLIGRQGGVMDLSRFAIGNIQKIEIVKGPSSSIYGSEAMGGVINIITDNTKGKQLRAGIRSGSFLLTDAFVSGITSNASSSLHYFINRNSSNGYDLDKSTPEKTLDPYYNYTGHIKFTHRFSPLLKLLVNTRYFKASQQSNYAINSSELNVGGRGRTNDLHVNPVLTYTRGSNFKSALRLLGSHYQFTQQLDSISNGKSYYFDDFRQGFYRIENQTDIDLSTAGTLTVGGGFTLQSVNTTRYAGRREQQIWHAFLQHEWTPLSQLHIIAGLRYDHNSAFAARVSPKLALQYRVHETLRFTASYGGGFKAPDFRQLYLSFVNNAADGYSIFGASEFSLALMLQQMRQGMIAQILPAAEQVTTLRPEISNGINAGMHWKPVAGFKMDVNLFRNDIRNLINYIPVATQANGTAVFSYVNTRRAFTQGIELQIEQKLNEQWQLSGGYQFLETADKDIFQAVKAGTVFGRDVPGAAARRMQLRDYHGLLNRSKHMANLRLFYQDQQRGWSGSLRFIYRSRLGVLDLDGNNFANMKAEFAPSILQVNIAIGKNITKHLALQTGVNNLLNQTNARFMPNMAGTHYFVTIQYTHKN